MDKMHLQKSLRKKILIQEKNFKAKHNIVQDVYL